MRRARRAISEIDLAVKEVGAAGRVEEGVLRIGIFTSLASGFIADLLERYRERHPGVRTEFVEGAPADHVAAVRLHEIDVAFLTGHPRAMGCEVTWLWRERVFVVLPETHELATKERIEWADLRGRHFIVSEADPGPEIYDYLFKHLSDLVQSSERGAMPCLQQGHSYPDGGVRPGNHADQRGDDGSHVPRRGLPASRDGRPSVLRGLVAA